MKKVIILLGPTGVGKTGASILLAQELGTEIISADSMQIYRGMDIGTAKPSRRDMALVKHHMIGIIEPSQSFSAGQYIDAVIPIIEGLHEKDRIPIIVGGTGLYIKAMTRGIFSGPSADIDLREELLLLESGSPGALYERLKKIDPEAAERITPNDTRRIIRALEVCIKSGRSMTDMQKNLTRPLPYEFLKVGLTRNRAELYSMIDKRVDSMIRDGLVKEVEDILNMTPDRTPMQAIGYKEIAGHLKGLFPMEEAIRLVKRNSRRYAKRQFTWFRKEEEIEWIDLTGIYDSVRILLVIEELLKRRIAEFQIAIHKR